jgi:CHAT domain-containing protein
MGLRASVIAAGARTMVMSLWKVPDEATVKLMEEFYQNLWVRKMPKAEALLRAQEAVRDDSSAKYKLPVNWAAWTLVGEGW